MDDVALANYIAGSYFGNVEAGRVDLIHAKLLGVKPCTEIWFSEYTLSKLRQRHGDINFAHYSHMPSILLQGFLATGRTKNVLELWWVHGFGSSAVTLLVVLKATKNGEIFVATFHRIHLREARRLWKRAKCDGRLVREQAQAEALLQTGTDHLKGKKMA
jgi:predicted O-methyltransferase YrrM